MLQVFPREKRAVIRADVLISAAAISSAKRFAQIEVVTDSPLEEAGFEPWVPDEGKPSHASITFDRYRRHSRRSDTCAPTYGDSDSSRYGCGWHPVQR